MLATLREVQEGDVVFFPQGRKGRVTGVRPAFNGNLAINYSSDEGREKIDYFRPDVKVNIFRSASVVQKFTPKIWIPWHASPSLGCDPEVFVTHADGTVIPAWEFLQKKSANNKHVFWDGFQAEFAPDVDQRNSSCLSWMIDHIQEGLEKVLQKARKKFPDAKLSLKNVIEVPKEILLTAKDQHVGFGCTPSYNAYDTPSTLGINPRNLIERFAGGHLHFGSYYEKEQLLRVVKSMDKIGCMVAISLFAGFENPIRRKYYGKAGEYRLPRHGLEYRALPNTWLCHPIIAHLVVDIMRVAMIIGANNLNIWECFDEEAVEVINNTDVLGAREVLRRNKSTLEAIVKSLYALPITTYAAMKVIRQGIGETLENPEDIEKNWMLKSIREMKNDGYGEYETWKSSAKHIWVSHSEGHNCNVARAAATIARNQRV